MNRRPGDERRRRSSAVPLLLLAALWLLAAGQWRTRPVPLDRQTPSATAWRIDVNSADEATLALLPGIGRGLAARIVTHRHTHGPFASPADLAGVPGIGERTLERITPWVRLDGPTPAR